MSLSVISYAGGKGQQLARLLPLIPYDHTYVEPFGGSCQVLLNRQPSTIEVYNDIFGDVVNLFRVLRGDRWADLQAMLGSTLYAHDEFREAIRILHSDECEDPILRAWATFVMFNMGLSGKWTHQESNWSRTMGKPINTRRFWHRADIMLGRVHQRLRHVQIENSDAFDVILRWDSPTTVFYLDPPYVGETRSDEILYKHEAKEIPYHEALVSLLLDVQGKVVLSGYDHDVYHPLVKAGWTTVDYETGMMLSVSDSKARGSRVERVWLNPQAVHQPALFTM